MNTLSSGGLKTLQSWFSDKFTYEYIEGTARKTGFLQRKRKLDPVYLVYVLIFGISCHQLPSVEELHRRYVDFNDSPSNLKPIRNQSFRKWMNMRLVEFLRVLLDHYIEQMAVQSPARLKGTVQSFKDILIQDSSIIRISKKLYELHPAARSRNNSAGLKIHAVYSAISHSVTSTTITSERVHDSKMLNIGPEIKDSLLLNDLGYYSLQSFAKIQEHGGFFVSRVKSNAIPEVCSIISAPSDFISMVDIYCFTRIKLGDFLEKISKNGVYDLKCSFFIRKEKKIEHFQEFRVICYWNSLSKKWQLYMTNLPYEEFSSEDIYEIYRYRWVVELIFKELKMDYDLGKMLLGNVPLAYIHIYSIMLRFIISRDLYCWIISSTDSNLKYKYTPLLWSKIFAEKGLEFLSILNQQYFGICLVERRWHKLERSLRQLAQNRQNRELISLKFSSFQ